MFGQKQTMVVIFIDRNRLQFYGGGMGGVLTLDIPAALIRDLEIVNRDGLYTLVNEWLKQNNIGSNRLFFILAASSFFEKDITSRSESEQETEILAFYDSIPFDDLATKVISVEGKKRAIAANRDYLEAIRHAFSLQGYQTIAVVPLAALGVLAAKRWLDSELGSYVVAHSESVREQNILEAEEQTHVVTAPAVSHVPTSKNNPRLMILISFLGLLFLVLLGVVLTMTLK